MWAHAKKHVRSLSTFEGHMAGITWRNPVSCNNDHEYEEFFALLKQYYPLDEGCKLESCVNLYDT